MGQQLRNTLKPQKPEDDIVALNADNHHFLCNYGIILNHYLNYCIVIPAVSHNLSAKLLPSIRTVV